MKTSFNKSEVEAILPQKYPFRFVEEIVSYNYDQKLIIARQSFNSDEYFFEGHFPGNPIVPGVLLIESMAQTALILLSQLLKIEIKSAYLVKVIQSTFYNVVFPNETIFIQNGSLNKKGNFWEIELKIKNSSNKKIAKSVLLLKAEI